MNDNLSVMNLYNDINNINKIQSFNNNVKSDFSVDTDFEKVDVSFEWLDLMEDTVRYLDNILRNPNRFIVNEEEIVKVEQARRITVESIKHLSKHTNFIQEIEENGDVKPSKILNINKDESYNTYENRVIYTLIGNMRIFIDMRKRNLVTASYSKNHKKSQYTGVSRIGDESVSITVSMDSKQETQKEVAQRDDMTIDQRIAKLELRITDLTNTPVYKALAKEHVAKVIPPVKKTNLILKNVNFQYAMKLWNFLATFDQDSDAAVKSNKTYKDDKNIHKMFNDVFLLNYLVLNTMGEGNNNKIPPEKKKEVIDKLTSDMITKIVEFNADMPYEEIEKLIGEKMAIIKNKKEANIEEIQDKFNSIIQNTIKKIVKFDFGE